MKWGFMIFVCLILYGIVTYVSSDCTSCKTIAITFEIDFNPGVTTFRPSKNSDGCTTVKVTCSGNYANDSVFFVWYDLNDQDIGASGQGTVGSTTKTLVCTENEIFTLDKYPVSRAECLIE